MCVSLDWLADGYRSVALQVLVGHPDYEVTGGTVEYQGEPLLDLEPQERSQRGIFMRYVLRGGGEG